MHASQVIKETTQENNNTTMLKRLEGNFENSVKTYNATSFSTYNY